VEPRQKPHWIELTALLDRADRKGLEALSVEELKQLCRLYRQVTIDLSRARTDGDDPDLIRYLNVLAARAHGRVYAAKRVDLRFGVEFVTHTFPCLVRRHARPLWIAAGFFLLTSLASFLAVVRNPELAYSLFDENMIEFENIRLEKQEGEYRGNFTFDIGASPLFAVVIMGNNILVAIRTFGLGALLCLPGVLSLVFNGRMLGSLSGVVFNHGYMIDFYSLILTHGILELTAICIAGGAGLILGWSLIAPGPLLRREALRRSAVDAFGLLAGSILLLVMAGLIEAYVTPHFPQPVRWAVAAASALFLITYFGWGGKTDRRVGAGPVPLNQ
jgi:uncharacterized membrane protein SpoIIM required for sporulation